MKRRMVFLLFVGIVSFGYAQNVITLDEALNNSTTYLKGRIPAGSKMVVLNFTSKWVDLTEYIIEELTGYIVNDGVFTVVDRRNLEIIRQEMDFQLSGEVSDETAQSIGQKLGAQTIISGSISAIGNAYRLRIRAIAVETAAIQGMQNVDVRQDSRIAALTGTAYVGSIVTPSTNTKNTSINEAVIPAPSFISLNLDWGASTDAEEGGKSTATVDVRREVVDSYEKEALVMDVNIVNGKNPWVSISTANNQLIQTVQRASGIRFKVYGDGKSWRLQILTSDVTDYCYHEYKFSTRKNKVTEVDIPYSKLRQPDWGKRVGFNKSHINAITFFRNMTDFGSGYSSIKVFDFEIY